ncbi:CLUMA_CG021354, isoform A [Clunio marinus]|uniref:CLUMA_CG021354, isoform A n=1 Tax=Clunio marinus TaxID=568069 RepID=A0A1J1J7T6_9DIPT|nr:CLUMA_CG021354, isoform A [Clunio marinus]
MKTSENFILQGFMLSLIAQMVLTLSAERGSSERLSSAASSPSQGIVGALYRSAEARSESDKNLDSSQASRGQRCARCPAPAYYGGNSGYGDRERAPAYYGREDPYRESYRDPYYGRDRNWYYQPEYRNTYDRGYNRYDNRYYGREDPYYAREQNYYDPRQDPRYNVNNNYNSYRGNGYDNLNPTHYEAMRNQFQRDRSYGYDQYYDRFYDRPAYRASGGYYDNRNFRPYDETYRGSSGFDNSGRGYYFANQHGQRPSQSPQYPPPETYDQAQRPPSSHGNHYNPPQQQSHHTTTRVPPEFYHGKPAQSPHIQTVSSGTIGTVDSNPSTNNNKNNNKEIDDKEKNSSAYGRPSLGSSYLFDRSSDDAAADSGLSPPISTNDEKKTESANMEMKSETDA